MRKIHNLTIFCLFVFCYIFPLIYVIVYTTYYYWFNMSLIIMHYILLLPIYSRFVTRRRYRQLHTHTLSIALSFPTSIPHTQNICAPLFFESPHYSISEWFVVVVLCQALAAIWSPPKYNTSLQKIFFIIIIWKHTSTTYNTQTK